MDPGVPLRRLLEFCQRRENLRRLFLVSKFGEYALRLGQGPARLIRSVRATQGEAKESEGHRLTVPVTDITPDDERIAEAVQGLGDLVQVEVNAGEFAQRIRFGIRLAELAEYGQCLLLAGNRPLMLAKLAIGRAHVTKRDPLSVPVADLALYGQRPLSGVEGRAETAQVDTGG